MKRLTLYNYFRSSTSFRVRIALEIKKLDYEYKPIHLLNNGGEQNSDQYRALNPSGGVPTLVDGEKVIAQSFAILQYLDDAFPQTYQLFPKDPFERAQVLQLCEVVNADMHALQNLKVLQFLEKNYGFDQQQKDQWCQHWISTNFAALEKLLLKTSKGFSFGSSLTGADIFLIPQVITAQRFKTDLTPFPTIRAIHETCMKLPEFQKAHPFRQIDTPQNLRIQ